MQTANVTTYSVAVAGRCSSSKHYHYQLHQLQQAVRSWRSLSEDASKTLAQAFISCRLDYCNSLFFGISEGLMNQLQSFQSAAACLVTGTQRSDHITPALRQLHWLQVRRHKAHRLQGCDACSSVPVDFAIVRYLADDCRLVADARE